jgi:hypothetical protein
VKLDELFRFDSPLASSSSTVQRVIAEDSVVFVSAAEDVIDGPVEDDVGADATLYVRKVSSASRHRSNNSFVHESKIWSALGATSFFVLKKMS